jgi:mRNA-degrading endonuclease HigB of HigAB toxin-antitoxin module
MELNMRFVGQTEVAGFLAQSPRYGDTIRAWVAEMKNGKWDSAAALATDFKDLDTSELPSVVFYLTQGTLRIETIIDFRMGIVLMVAITPFTTMQGNAQRDRNARRDH